MARHENKHVMRGIKHVPNSQIQSGFAEIQEGELFHDHPYLTKAKHFAHLVGRDPAMFSQKEAIWDDMEMVEAAKDL